VKRIEIMTERNEAAAATELSPEEISAVTGGNGLVGPGAGKDGGGTIGSGT
jgi:hypothetical protein